MLEAGGVLQTYRLDVPPDRLARCKEGAATRIHDHPLKFLTYQGSVNKGLGNVKLVDSGTYRAFEESKNAYRLAFDGDILKGEFSLVRATGNAWKFASCPGSADS